MANPIQKSLTKVDLGAVGTPWQVTVPHKLNEDSPGGVGIIPTEFTVEAIRITFPGIGTVGMPTSCALVTGVGADNMTITLPPAADWSIPPSAAEVWVNVCRVHSIQGHYNQDAMAGPPPYAPGGLGPGGGILGTIVTVDQIKGNDSFPGTEEYPKATMAAALSIVVAGWKRIRVAPGIYQGGFALHGELSIEAVLGDVIFATVDEDCAWRADGTGEVTINGCEFEVAGGSGHDAFRDEETGGEPMNMRDCIFSAEDDGDTAYRSDNGQNVFLRDCEFEGIVRLDGAANNQFIGGYQFADINVPAMQLENTNGCRVYAFGCFNQDPGANAHAIELDNDSGSVVMNTGCDANGGHGLRLINGSISEVLFNQLIGGAADLVIDAASVGLMAPNDYNPAASIITGGVQRIPQADLAGDLYNPANFVPAHGDQVDVIDRIASAVVGLLGFPIP
ncbi:MAG: hypothetical protein K0U84_14130 [Actinomycetia bacterium]|nr:hypothetical protein [Actinomycetes bacterium]